MNIWSWVQATEAELRAAGNERLATLMNGLPSDVTGLRHQQVDAQLPEAVALARQARKPWVELFLRHWGLQSRIFWRMEGEQALAEATHLLEFAHREENQGCPQSVCVTQDLAGCYGRVDGPGYAEARIAVADESLRRITPRWNCFSCICAERVLAMLDMGQTTQALEFLDQQSELARGVDPTFPMSIGSERVAILSALGRHEEALDLARQLERAAHSAGRRAGARLMVAGELAALGRAEEALAAFPSFARTQATPAQYQAWARAAKALADLGALPNDGALQHHLGTMAARLERTGSWSIAWELHELKVRLAFARGWRETAALSLAAMRRAVDHFRLKPPREAALASLQAQLEALPVMDQPAESQPHDAGDRLERLAPFARAHPEHQQAWLDLAQTLEALGHAAEAEDALVATVRRAPGEAPLRRLVTMQVNAGRTAAARALADDALAAATDDASRVFAHQVHAFIALRTGDLREQRRHLAALCQLAPDVHDFALLACAEREAGDLEAAFARAADAVSRWPEPGPHHWELMVCGALLGRWESVRSTWRGMGNQADGEGPFAADYGLVRVRLETDDGEEVCYARRLGPVTARVISVPGTSDVNRLDDVVVLDGRRLDVPAEDAGPDDDVELPLLSAVATLSKGACRVITVEGLSPGTEVLGQVRLALRALGVHAALFSAEHEFTLADGTEHTGAYLRLGLPPDVDAEAVAALLAERLTSPSTPLFWPGLLELLGQTEEAAAQRAQALELGLELDPPLSAARGSPPP